ncbi:MAG: flagellar basal body-associated protein FliL [Alphaproteobacteria bacterium]|nr:MAG: flagellar basal body-associated protein FliL [Alphaproteobacteria bacterium]
MMRLLIPLVMVVLGLGIGGGVGLALRPAPEPPADGTDHASVADCPAPATEVSAAETPPEGGATTDIVKLSNQFVVPVVAEKKVSSLVVLSISIEVTAGSSSEVYKREPKLRDAFLQVLFNHANSGGFDGAFTDSNLIKVLKRSLLEAAKKVLGGTAQGILITDLARQDV